jgi:hypothetical protein
MLALLNSFLAVLSSPFKSKSRLEAQDASLRHQLIVLRHKMQGRVLVYTETLNSRTVVMKSAKNRGEVMIPVR